MFKGHRIVFSSFTPNLTIDYSILLTWASSNVDSGGVNILKHFCVVNERNI